MARPRRDHALRQKMSDRAKPFLPSGPLDPVAAEIAAYFQADPVWQGLKTRPVTETRAAIKAAMPPVELRAVGHIEDFRVPVTGGEIGLRLYRPVPRPAALIVWAHGGGYALGSVDELDSFARALAVETGCAVASVDYRLAPEHKFPTAVEDLMTATRWAAERRAELAGGLVPLVLGGDSAGANLATVATRKLHESKACLIAGSVLAYPSTDGDDAASLRRFVPPFLSVAEVSWFFDQYLPDRSARNHPDFAPLHATSLDQLPPTFIITAEHDILTEQAEDYGQKLKAAGVDVRISRHPGMIHGFLTMDVFFSGAAGKAMLEIGDFIADVAIRVRG
jgi:acetyl esterase/lipase